MHTLDLLNKSREPSDSFIVLSVSNLWVLTVLAKPHITEIIYSSLSNLIHEYDTKIKGNMSSLIFTTY